MNHSNNSLTRAAIVLSRLSDKQAAQILAKLKAGDMQSVLGAAKVLDDVSPEQVTDSLREFRSEFNSLSPKTEDTPQKRDSESSELVQAKLQIEKALSSRPSEISRSGESSRPFDFLLETHAVLRTHLLSDEHPKNIAIVLSMFTPDAASATMSGLDANLRISVLKRMCELDEIHDDDVIELSYAIRMRFNKLLNSSAGRLAGLKSAANLLSCSDAATREALLTHVGQSDPDLARMLKHSVFGIKRLEAFSNLDVKTVLKNVDTSCWAPAIKNAGPELIDKILSNMAESPRELLSLEIAEIGHVESTRQDEARRNIVKTVLKIPTLVFPVQ